MVSAYGSRQEGDYWVTKTSTLLKTIMLKFKLEEEFDDLTPDGRHVSSFSIICKHGGDLSISNRAS